MDINATLAHHTEHGNYQAIQLHSHWSFAFTNPVGMNPIVIPPSFDFITSENTHDSQNPFDRMRNNHSEHGNLVLDCNDNSSHIYLFTTIIIPSNHD